MAVLGFVRVRVRQIFKGEADSVIGGQTIVDPRIRTTGQVRYPGGLRGLMSEEVERLTFDSVTLP